MNEQDKSSTRHAIHLTSNGGSHAVLAALEGGPAAMAMKSQRPETLLPLPRNPALAPRHHSYRPPQRQEVPGCESLESGVLRWSPSLSEELYWYWLQTVSGRQMEGFPL